MIASSTPKKSLSEGGKTRLHPDLGVKADRVLYDELLSDIRRNNGMIDDLYSHNDDFEMPFADYPDPVESEANLSMA